MSVLGPAEVERWLLSLGSLLPTEAVKLLVQEVRSRQMNGVSFGDLVASRDNLSLGDALRPAHMAKLRRVWSADHGARLSRQSSAQSQFSLGQGQGQSLAPAFAPAPRAPPRPPPPQPPQPPQPGAAQALARAPKPLFTGDFGEQPWIDCTGSIPRVMDPVGHALFKDESPPGSPMFPTRVAGQSHNRPAQVPHLDLSHMHSKSIGNRGVLGRQGWMEPGEVFLNSRDRGLKTAHEQRPLGFAYASVDDQQRISEYYGYRDEGFIATMNGLKTDMIRPRLYVGTMADAAYWPLIQSLSISHVLNVAVEAQSAPPPYEGDATYLLLPLQDSPDQTQVLMRQRFRSLRSATLFIDLTLKSRKGAILVHCVQGLSRSAAVVAAYLMEYGGVGAERAIAELQEKHAGCLSGCHWKDLLYKFGTELLRGL